MVSTYGDFQASKIVNYRDYLSHKSYMEIQELRSSFQVTKVPLYTLKFQHSFRLILNKCQKNSTTS